MQLTLTIHGTTLTYQGTPDELTALTRNLTTTELLTTKPLTLSDPYWHSLDHDTTITIHTPNCDCDTDYYTRSGQAQHPTPQHYQTWLTAHTDTPVHISPCAL